jgi:DNA end-binding protein Ku
VKSAELQLARQLIEQGATEGFDPAAYADEVKARIEKAVQGKVEGHEISISEAPTEAGGAQVIDLMDALRASLKKKAPATAKPTPAETRKPAKRAQQEPAVAAKKTARKK